MEIVNLSFRYVEGDYVQAVRAHYRTRLRLPLDIAVILVTASLGAYEFWSGSSTFGIVLLSISGLFALFLIIAFIVVPRVTFRRQPKFRDQYFLQFSQEGIHFQTAHIDSNLKWRMYTSALVDANSFILYWGTQQFTVIPKRVFEDSSQLQQFEQLLLQNISNIVDKTKSRPVKMSL